MPKRKSHKSSKKRFRVTGGGHVKRWKAGKSHLLSTKSRKRKRNLRKAGLVSPELEKKVKEALLA